MKREKVPPEIMTSRSVPLKPFETMLESTVSTNDNFGDGHHNSDLPLSLRPCPYQGSAAPPSDDDEDCDSVDYFESQPTEVKRQSTRSDASEYTNESVHSPLPEQSTNKPVAPEDTRLIEAMRENSIAHKFPLEQMYLNSIHENESLKIAFERANLAGKAALERLEALEASSSNPISRTPKGETGLHVLLKNIEDTEDGQLDEMQKMKRDAIKSRLKYVARIAGLRRRIQASDWKLFQACMEREEKGFKEGYDRGEKDTTEKLRQEMETKEDIWYERGFHKGEQEGFEKGLVEGRKETTFHSDRYEEALFMGLKQAEDMLAKKYSEGFEAGQTEAMKDELHKCESPGYIPYGLRTPSPIETGMSYPSPEYQLSSGCSSLVSSGFFNQDKSPLYQEYFSDDVLAPKKSVIQRSHTTGGFNVTVGEEDDVFEDLKKARVKPRAHTGTSAPPPGEWIKRPSPTKQSTFDEKSSMLPATTDSTNPIPSQQEKPGMQVRLDKHFKGNEELKFGDLEHGKWWAIANKKTTRIASGAINISNHQVPLGAPQSPRKTPTARRPSISGLFAGGRTRSQSLLSSPALVSAGLNSNGLGSANQEPKIPKSGSNRKLMQVLGDDYPQK